MSLEAILARIEADAAARVEEIEAEAAAREKELLDEAEGRAAKRRAEILTAAERERELTGERLADMAELTARKRRLAARQSLLDEVVEAAVAELAALETKPYRELFAGLVGGAGLSGPYEVLTSEAEARRLDDAFLASLEGVELTLSGERRELGGGFVLRRDRQELNFSFRALVEGLRRRLERRLLAELEPAGDS